ncbi:MAG: aromatic hydrocarbon degradation protein [Ferruginibacter sp.]
MKKYLVLLCIISGTNVFAQLPEDALRYSWYPQNGTARVLAIGGAMGSLGGDITATFVNPAGLGFYKTGDAVISPGFFLNKVKADYFNNRTVENKNAFGFGPSGFVMGAPAAFKTNRSYAFSIAVTQAANFNNVIHYKALNHLTSFSEQFAEEFAKSGYSIDQVLDVNSPLPYTSAPALYSFLIDTVTIGNVLKVKAAPEYILDAGQALQQEMFKTTSGGVYEVALGGAVNLKEKWLFGGSVGIPLINYKSNTTFKESDTSTNTNNFFNAYEYNDNFTTQGVGINIKLGAIYRPQEYFRLGLAVHTPSFMWLTDKRTTTLNTQLENPVKGFSATSTDFTNNQPGNSKYTQSSTWKAILSASYVFREIENVKKQRAFITADIEYLNHNGSKFRSDNPEVTLGEKAYYKDLNEAVKDEYKGALNFRVGGELKFNTIMGRLGFAYYSSPYQDATLKASHMLLSGGLGYRNQGFFIDLTYIHNITKDINFPYRLQDRDFSFASIKQQQGNIAATVGWKF